MGWFLRGEVTVLILMAVASVVVVAISIYEIISETGNDTIGALILVALGVYWMRILWRDIQRQRSEHRNP